MDDPEFGRRDDEDPLISETSALTGEEDQLLVTSLRRWLHNRHVGSNKRAADAIRRWMTAKGLDC